MVAWGTVAAPITGGPDGASMVIVIALESVPAVLVAVTVTLLVPAVLGVPVSTPPDDNVKPEGKPVALHVGLGLPVATKEYEAYAAPAVPFGGVNAVIAGATAVLPPQVCGTTRFTMPFAIVTEALVQAAPLTCMVWDVATPVIAKAAMTSASLACNVENSFI